MTMFQGAKIATPAESGATVTAALSARVPQRKVSKIIHRVAVRQNEVKSSTLKPGIATWVTKPLEGSL